MNNSRLSGQPWPRITIVTPSYNQAAYIEATIQSVLRQAYPNLEYIIIDGGSTDGSVDIIRRYERELAFWISRPDNGMYEAINEGFAHATGEVMAWLNSDDMYLPWTLQTVGEIFAQYRGRVQWICGMPGYWNTDNMLVAVDWPVRLARRLIRLGAYENRCLGFIQQESTFWSRTLWRQAGAALDASFRLAGDFDLWRRFAMFAAPYRVQTILAGFRKHKGQQTDHSLDQYYLEVAKSLEDQPGKWVRALLTHKLIRLGLLLSLRMFDVQHVVRYDLGRHNWVVEGD